MCFTAVMNMFRKKQYYIDECKRLETANTALMVEYEGLEKKYDELYLSWEALNDEKLPNPIEEYWNTKRLATDDYLYPARTIINGLERVDVDTRIFFTESDSKIPIVDGANNDEKAYNALKKVHDDMVYMSDTSMFKQPEEWLFAYETLALGNGDCEDGAIFMANIMLKSGIPYWRVRLNAGDVNGGGHCWVTYLRESDDKWVILDWCYFYEDAIKGLLWKDAENYFDIWFSFNKYHIFAEDMLDKEVNE